MEQTRELLENKALLDLLKEAIQRRSRVRMEVPGTPYSWITVLLDLEGKPPTGQLVIDPVPDLERAFRLQRTRDVSLSFSDSEGAPCSCSTPVLNADPQAIRTGLPEVIVRVQRRAFFRIKAAPGSEVVFRDPIPAGMRARVKDYSQGGLAFYKDPYGEEFSRLVEEVQLKDNRLVLPAEGGVLEIPIPLAVVRRIAAFPPHTIQGALEFLRVPEASRLLLSRLIVDQERLTIQRIKKQETSAKRFFLSRLWGNRGKN